MSWISSRYQLGTFEPPWYDPDTGPPDVSKVPQWSTPGSPRIEAYWRWITEPKHRPMAHRLLMQLDYSNINPQSQAGLYDFTEFAWIALSVDGKPRLRGSTTFSPYGSRIIADIAVQADDYRVQPAEATSCWHVTTPGDPSIPMIDEHGSTLNWNYPERSLTVGPSIEGTCSQVPDRILNDLRLSVDGITVVTELPEAEDWLSDVINGGYPMTLRDICAYAWYAWAQPDIEWDLFGPFLNFFAQVVAAGPGFSRWFVRAEFDFTTQGPFGPSQCQWQGPVFPNGTEVATLPVDLDVIPGSNIVGDVDFSTAEVSLTLDSENLDSHRFPYKRIRCHGFSECYPVDTFPPPDDEETVMNRLPPGVIANFVPGQSIDAGFLLDLQAPSREIGGIWWLAGNPSEIVIPPPWNFVTISAHINTSTARQHSLGFYAKRNGSENNWEAALRHNHPWGQVASNASVHLSSQHLEPVSPGDIITFHAEQNGGAIGTTANRNWVSVIGHYLV